MKVTEYAIPKIIYGDDIKRIRSKLNMTQKDVYKLLEAEEALLYPKEERERVRKAIFEQMRKYPYLFE